MKIILQIKVHTEDNEIVLNYSKHYESLCIPSKGDRIKDDLFAVSKEIIQVEIDYSKDECFVTLESRVETKERLNGHIQEVAEMHNWIESKE